MDWIFRAWKPPYHWIVRETDSTLTSYELQKSWCNLSLILSLVLAGIIQIGKIVSAAFRCLTTHDWTRGWWTGGILPCFRTFENYWIENLLEILALVGRIISDRSRRCFSGWSDHLTFYFHRNISYRFVGIFRRSRCVAGHDSPLLSSFYRVKTCVLILSFAMRWIWVLCEDLPTACGRQNILSICNELPALVRSIYFQGKGNFSWKRKPAKEKSIFQVDCIILETLAPSKQYRLVV